MTDHLSPRKRSWNMAQIPAGNTRPEKMVRSLLHRNGYRFSLHRKELPGKPDIVMPRFNTVVFVHGCFWHRHKGCRDATMPKSRTAFWSEKFKKNVARDRKVRRQLKSLGWNIIIVWECETKNPEKLLKKLERGLSE